MLAEKIAMGAAAAGLATVAGNGTVLETWFRSPRLDRTITAPGTRQLTPRETVAAFGDMATRRLGRDPRRDVTTIAVHTSISDLSAPPVDVHDVYLRLHLLSHRLIRPRQANLDDAPGLLCDVAWTSLGPCLPERLDTLLWLGRTSGFAVTIRGIFRIPRMVDYVVPQGVGIADANRVLLGAHLAPGTILSPEGFCSFNAGTLGPAMVEGRISAGVVVDEGTHVGGGASIMGTISGGGRQVISVGRHCLLGANSGLGISLGDGCAVEAGCYVTAGAPVTLSSGDVVKAVALSGRPGMLFRRHGRLGRLEAIEQQTAWGGLNPQLHPTVTCQLQPFSPALTSARNRSAGSCRRVNDGSRT